MDNCRCDVFILICLITHTHIIILSDYCNVLHLCVLVSMQHDHKIVMYCLEIKELKNKKKCFI